MKSCHGNSSGRAVRVDGHVVPILFEALVRVVAGQRLGLTAEEVEQIVQTVGERFHAAVAQTGRSTGCRRTRPSAASTCCGPTASCAGTTWSCLTPKRPPWAVCPVSSAGRCPAACEPGALTILELAFSRAWRLPACRTAPKIIPGICGWTCLQPDVLPVLVERITMPAF